MTTKAITVISCHPFSGRAFPVDFTVKSQLLMVGNNVIVNVEFSGNVANLTGYRPDGSKFTSNLHLHSADAASLRRFVP